jgi:hypothetical protein
MGPRRHPSFNRQIDCSSQDSTPRASRLSGASTPYTYQQNPQKARVVEPVLTTFSVNAETMAQKEEEEEQMTINIASSYMNSVVENSQASWNHQNMKVLSRPVTRLSCDVTRFAGHLPIGTNETHDRTKLYPDALLLTNCKLKHHSKHTRHPRIQQHDPRP